MELLKEMESYGFINGTIKQGKYNYIVKLITNRQYEQYKTLLEQEGKDLEAIKYIISVCIYRNEFKNKLIGKSKIIQVYDFNIDDYPAALTPNFVKDLFIILLDKDFFQKLKKGGE